MCYASAPTGVHSRSFIIFRIFEHICRHHRELFRTAIMNNRARIVLYHNYPSGNLEPSEANIAFTRRVIECGEMIGIEVTDHIIVNESEYFSLIE